MKIFLIIFFGVLGVLGRYSIESFWSKNQIFPFSTLFINLIGCLFAGIIYGLMTQKGLGQLGSVLLIGFCGGLTTFSGLALQGVNLLQKGEYFYAFSYVCISSILGLFIVYCGLKLSEQFSY